MEQKLFKWEGWDLVDTMAIVFYECTLNIPIGPYSKGQLFDSINIDFGTGKMELWQKSSEEPALIVDLELDVVK